MGSFFEQPVRVVVQRWAVPTLRSFVLCLGVGAYLSRLPALAAPPEVNYVFPAGVQVGQRVEVTASGKFDAWPVQIWVDRPGLSMAPGEKKGTIAVTAEAQAAPGLYWFRLYNAEGATPPRPFFVGTLPEVVEAEPNNDYRELQTLDPPIPPLSRGGQGGVIVNGRLARQNDVDAFAVPLRAGQTLVASMEANARLGSPMDGVLQIVAPGGFVLEQNDDCHGMDPQLVFTAPQDGTYVVRTFAFPATPDASIRFSGANEYVYRLTITTGGFVDHTLPLAVSRDAPGELRVMGWNVPESAARIDAAALVGLPASYDGTVELAHPLLANTVPVLLVEHSSVVETEALGGSQADSAAQPVTLPATITGRIDRPGDVDAFEFAATKGQRLSFEIAASELGYALDPVLQVTDAEGKVLERRDDDGRDERDVNLDFTAPADGKYHIAVRDLYGHGGFRYVYRLRAGAAEPDFALTLKEDRFTLTPGKPLEIEVSVERQGGLPGAIEVSAEGLPEHVKAQSASESGASSNRSSRSGRRGRRGGSGPTVKLRLQSSTGPWNGPFRVVGRAAEPENAQHTATAPIAGLQQRTTTVWLTIAKP